MNDTDTAVIDKPAAQQPKPIQGDEHQRSAIAGASEQPEDGYEVDAAGTFKG